MSKTQFCVGVDVASESLAASIYTSPDEKIITQEAIKNSIDGFEEFLIWLKENNVTSSNAVICMEATGVYGEALCHFLVSKQYRVAVEPPLKVKRAFNPEGHKTDPADSRQIAEYAYRFFDELRFWSPKEEVIEKVRQLLTLREQLTKQSTALQCSLVALQRHPVKNPFAIKTHEKTLNHLAKSIEDIDHEIKRLIGNDPTFRQMVHLLDGVPGVGVLLASNLMVFTRGFSEGVNPRKLAAYIGICPYRHQSGKSVFKKSSSRHYGPAVLRKLLYLGAKSVCTHNTSFGQYYLRKLQEGKDKHLIDNNVANKLLKIMCAVINAKSPYIPNYRSVNPALL